MSQFLDWLALPGVTRCCLIDITLANKTVRISNYAFCTLGSDTPAHTAYDDVLYDDIELGYQLDDWLFGKTLVKHSAIKFLQTPFLQGLLNDDFDNALVEIYLGDPSWPKANFKLIATWYAVDLVPDGVNYQLNIRDGSLLLDVPVCRQYQSGAAQGQYIPRCFGTVFNAEPVMISTGGNGEWQINDGPIDSLVVRDGGLTVAATVNLAAGTFTLNAAPQGRITCDVVQSHGTCQAIVTQLLTESDMVAKDGTFSAVPAYALGLFINDATTRLSAIDQCFSSVGFVWHSDALNQLSAIKISLPSGAAAGVLVDDDIDPDTLHPKRKIYPAPVVNVHYRKNYAPQSDGLFGAVSVANRELFKKEFSTVSVENASVPDNYPVINANTLLVSQADALVIATERAAMNAQLRLVYEFTAYSRSYQFALGDEIDTQYMTDLSANGLVIGSTQSPIVASNVLEVVV